MSFILENVKNGKNIILYDNFKYRESYSLKNNDIVWRCLGKSCKATIITNGEKTIIHDSKGAHNGQHPVTMRALSSTTPSQKKRLAISSTPDDKVLSPQAMKSSPTVRLPNSSTFRSSYCSIIKTPASTPLKSESLKSKMVSDICCQTEDEQIKTKDDLIERISQLTHQQSCLVLKCQSLQLQLEEAQKEVNNLKERVEKQDAVVQSDVQKNVFTPSECPGSETSCRLCVILREETTKMIESIRVLEAENLALKECLVCPQSNIEKQSSISFNNSFSVLVEENPEQTLDDEGFTKVDRKVSNKKRKKRNRRTHKNDKGSRERVKKASFNSTEQPRNINTKYVYVFADSHGKDLHIHLSKKLPTNYKVFVNACPGAPLKHIINNAESMIQGLSKDDTVVIIGGANDINGVTPNNIRPARVLYGYLERFVNRNSHTNFTILSQFHNHHLHPYSLVNKEMHKVNAKLKGLQNLGVNLVDTASLQRRCFTQHGQHLNKTGKQVVCSKIVAAIRKNSVNMSRSNTRIEPDSLQQQSTAAVQTPPSGSSPQTDNLSALPEPIVLAHDTYADAVKSPRRTVATESSNIVFSPDNYSDYDAYSDNSSDIFLSQISPQKQYILTPCQHSKKTVEATPLK